MLRERKIRRLVFGYCLFNFLRGLHFFSAVLVPFFTDWAGLTMFQVQSLQSWFMFCIFLLEIPSGVLADFLGRKKILFLSCLVYLLASLVYGSCPEFWCFVLGEFLFALNISLLSGADQALIFDTLQEWGKEDLMAEIQGKSFSVRTLGYLLSAPIGSLIASIWGLNYPMLLTAVPALISVIPLLFIPEFRDKGETSSPKKYGQIAREGFLYFRGHKLLREEVKGLVLVSSSAYFVLWFYQPLMSKVGLPLYSFGFAYAFLSIMETIISMSFLQWEKLLGGSDSFLTFSALATGVGLLIAGIYHHWISVFLLLALSGGFGLTRRDYLMAKIQPQIESSCRATVISLVSMFLRFVLFLLNPLMGWLAERSLSTALVFSSLPTFVAVLIRLKKFWNSRVLS